MRTHKDVGAAQFAARLQQVCQDRGHVSRRNASGVDVSAVATNGGVSYEMARRYLAGLAVPNDEAMRQLADWLRVPMGWLAFGEAGPSPKPGEDISATALELVLLEIQRAQEISGVTLSPARLAALAAALYRETADGKAPSARMLAASLRALA